jgi:hypothetical protein
MTGTGAQPFAVTLPPFVVNRSLAASTPANVRLTAISVIVRNTLLLFLIVNSMFEKPGSVTGVPTNVNVTSGFVSASGKTGVALAVRHNPANAAKLLACRITTYLLGRSMLLHFSRVKQWDRARSDPQSRPPPNETRSGEKRPNAAGSYWLYAKDLLSTAITEQANNASAEQEVARGFGNGKVF